MLTINGQLVGFTGTTYVDGQHWKRDDLEAAARSRGADVVPRGSRNRRMTLLVLGDLDPAVVTDPVHNRSQTAVFVYKQRAVDNHICIVDDRGISALIRGEPAACLVTLGVDEDTIEISQPRPRRPRLMPLTISAAPVHEPTGLDLDMSRLDRATAAHQATLRALVEHLAPVEVQGLSRPKVDAVWLDPERPYRLLVGEVKSLTGARQDQQLRLGIGQTLDYVHQVRLELPSGVEEAVPALILEREPSDVRRWLSLCKSLGIRLAWPPRFDGL